jgi:Rrf2 family protein
MLTSKGKYGLRALLHLADNEGQGPSLITDIAAKNNIRKKFLHAILLELKNAGVLASKKGRGGGYSLARPANRIIIADIIRALDGPLAPIPCASRTAHRRCADCRDTPTRRIRGLRHGQLRQGADLHTAGGPHASGRARLPRGARALFRLRRGMNRTVQDESGSRGKAP